ncbi:MAG TPA: DUF3999 domain-containing protein [Xanthomonadales bacterium]|nr:DUF3999 domain-containing protein [Xanthomonadales bacterium]
MTPLMLLALAVAAPVPTEFARSWPLELSRDEGAYRIELGEDVYRHLVQDDLSDLVVFDAAGAAVPFGPVPLPRDAAPTLLRTTQALPWFRVPREPGARIEESLELNFTRGADGRLAPVVRSASTIEAPAEEVILDASAVSGGIDSVELALAPGAAGSFSARVDVLASDDLMQWRTVAADQAVMSLEHQGRRLERRSIELPSLDANYLLLRRAEGAGTLPLAGATAHSAQYAPGIPAGRGGSIAPAPAAADTEGAFVYDTGGPFPIDRAQLALAQPNSVVSATIESRAAPDAAWTVRARTTAFRLRTGGTEIANLADDIERSRDREWRVTTSPPLAAPPRLVLGYRADPFLLLAQGEPPYRLAAGSHVQRRPAYPLGALLSELQARLGPHWSPAVATIGAGAPVPGAASGPPPPPLPWLRWALWIVLVGGAGAILLMVAQLLRERTDPK